MSEQLHRDVTQAGPSMAPKLEVTQGENKGETFKVKMTTRIGRERDNDVVLLDLKSSRYHAEIRLDSGQWRILDLGSANGTFVNEAAVTVATPLNHDDVIRLGETELKFSLPVRPDAAAATTTPTPATATGGSHPPTPAQVPRRGEASQIYRIPQQLAQRSSRLVWIVGGVLALLCVVALFVVYLVTSRFSPPAGEGSADNVVGTRAATIEAASDAGSNTSPATAPAGEIPGRPAELSLVYEDDFSDSFGGWDDAFDAYTRKVYGNNRYNIEVFASNLVAWGLANRIVSDFEIEVEGKLEDGDETDSYGLIFRFQDRDNFYRYDISGDGYFLFSKFVDGEWETLIDWTPSEFINPGNATNVLKVSAFGPNITLFVNGQQLASVTDDSLERGNFGFFTGTFAEPYSWVSFDNLKMWTTPGQELVLVPTPTPLGATPLASAPTTSTATPLPATPTPAAEQAEQPALADSSLTESPLPTPTDTPEPTAEPTVTPTPEPLPEYVSRDQPLGRGEVLAEGQIVFPVYDSLRGVYDIYMADIADGDNLMLLQKSASQPALNPEGTEFAYRSWQPDKRGLYARKLTDDPENAWGFDLFFESSRPQYSYADGTLMYHSRTGGREPAIYQVVNGVGEVKRRDGAPIQGKSPKWSPDGSQFVYNGCLGSQCGIMLSNVDGSAPVLLTDNPSDTNPEISPDGSSIIFMSERAGNWEIYRMDITGENLEALTTDKSSDGLPTWSPDGSRIAFVSNRDGEWGMWVMNADGSSKRRQFAVDGVLDGIIQHDVTNSFGWVEENIDWIP